ncbi:MAG: hypothetical protein F4010_00770 [Cenarchaeum sp. SB0669_bin_11]|nr:hypothetical protein [Cenarchaeum sp. SB0669_bin_11]
MLEKEQERKVSIARAFSDWEGEKLEEMTKIYEDDCTAFDNAHRDLEHYRDSWVDEWIHMVDDHNYNVYSNTVQSLQTQLIAYHAKVAAEEGHHTGSDIAHNVADEVLERITFGKVNLRKDEAGELVPPPRKVRDVNWIPSPPHYDSTSVFVEYLRCNPVDPTAGMEDHYSDTPG